MSIYFFLRRVVHIIWNKLKSSGLVELQIAILFFFLPWIDQLFLNGFVTVKLIYELKSQVQVYSCFIFLHES